MIGKTWLMAGALLGALGVAGGAFGAHWLEGAVQRWTIEPDQQQRQIEIWNTAVRYQMYHALALIAVGIMLTTRPNRALQWAGLAFLLGTLIFSGFLYALVLSGIRAFGMIVPIGGLLLIGGWVALAVAVWRNP